MADQSKQPLEGELQRALLGFRPKPGAYVMPDEDLRTALEILIGTNEPESLARSDLISFVCSLRRLELAVMSWLIRAALDHGEEIAFSWSELGRALGYRRLGARNADALRMAAVRVTTPAIHRRLLELRPGPGGVLLPERDTVIGLFEFPPRLRPRGASRTDTRRPSSLVRLDEAYRPFTPLLGRATPESLRNAPSDMACRLLLLADYLSADPRGRTIELSLVELAAVLRPNDSNRRRAMVDMRRSVAYASDSRGDIVLMADAGALAINRSS